MRRRSENVKLDIEKDTFIRSNEGLSKFPRKSGLSVGKSKPKPGSSREDGKNLSILPQESQGIGRTEPKLDRTPSSGKSTSETQKSQSPLRNCHQKSHSSPPLSKLQRISSRMDKSPVKKESHLLNPIIAGEKSKRAITHVSKRKKQHESGLKEQSCRQLRQNKEDLRQQKEFIDEFRKYLNDNKSKKVMLYCSCPEKKNERFLRFFKLVGDCFKKAGRFTRIACCPPLPSYQVNKAAFWPPERFYVFFHDPKPPDLVDPLKAETLIRKANGNCLGLKYRVAPDHACSKEKLFVEGFVIETAHGNHLGCAMVRSRPSSAICPALTMLYAHSNGEDLYDILYSTPDLIDMATYYECDVVTFDYSGYGISSGKPDEDQLYADVEAVWLHVTEKMKVPSDRVILFGYSIGTAAIIHLANKCSMKYRPAGVVLIAPMCTVFSVVCACCSPRCEHAMRADRYNNYAKITSICAPVLIIHGERDTVVPISHGKKLYRKMMENGQCSAAEPLWIPEANHNHLTDYFTLWERVATFLKKEIIQPKSKASTPKAVRSSTIRSNVKTEKAK